MRRSLWNDIADAILVILHKFSRKKTNLNCLSITLILSAGSVTIHDFLYDLAGSRLLFIFSALPGYFRVQPSLKFVNGTY